jgi:hypothetical protein
MSLENSIESLAAAIIELAKSNFTLAATGYRTAVAAETVAAATAAPETEKRGRGRPPGSSAKKAEPATPEEFKDVTPQPADAVAEEKAAPKLPAGVELTKHMVQNTLIELVKKHGRDACGTLCRKHGGPNLTALDPAVYPALYAEARQIIDQPAQA